eukprot:7835485-Karenia_brevis.AAC.1
MPTRAKAATSRRQQAARARNREVQIHNANARLQERRAALRVLNGLFDELNFAIDKINVKEPDPAHLQKVFGLFAKRWLQEPHASAARGAFQKWTSNGGSLPE